jgi:hypothetical protein
MMRYCKYYNLPIVSVLLIGAINSDWIFLGNQNDGTKIYVDKSTITKDGSIVRYWQRNDYVNDPAGYAQIKLLREDNCRTHQTHALQASALMTDGSGATEAEAKPWEFVVPDTTMDEVHKFVCNQ